MALVMNVESKDDSLLLHLDGELTGGESARFKNWVLENVHELRHDVRVECDKLEYLDSTGLGCLIFLRKHVLDQGVRLELRGVNGWLRKFLRVTGLEQAFCAREEAEEPAPPERQA